MIKKKKKKKVITKIVAVISFIVLLTTLILNFNDVKNIFSSKVDITGEWTLNFHIQETSYNAYNNKTAEYKMHFIQSNKQIKGEGEKWRFNNKELPFNEHDPLIVTGKYKNDSIYCTYVLKGVRRETKGSFVVAYENDEMNGYFSGTAANSKGKVSGKRVK
ncbi:hypothetical protein H2O64_18145 [Kordia sp. YSTF-M3]|uniref:Uncharacterized protein n=1 Tax=Kordia aestuariivivens TaxID=2759037 RepID=A0ABR7QDF7_9FLAO|nr:hypothetical protein [Kordia aestuariivivens]MBC8756599.1 hypothetical protein [Kordia aestuariivivens]